MGEIGIQEELTLAGFDHTGGPEDGDKKITLGMGAKMEHDANVWSCPQQELMYSSALSQAAISNHNWTTVGFVWVLNQEYCLPYAGWSCCGGI